VGVSLPTFVTGILLIYIFSVTFTVLPSYGRGEVVKAGSWDTRLSHRQRLESIILPSITLCLYQLTLIPADCPVRDAGSVADRLYQVCPGPGGSPTGPFTSVHALKNTLIPVITVTGLQVGSLIAFSIITETVFPVAGNGIPVHPGGALRRHPDHGRYMTLVALFFVIINLIVDLLYFVVDPRLRIERRVAG